MTASTAGTSLTAADRHILTAFRTLAAIGTPDGMREHTGESDLRMAYIIAYGELRFLAGEMAAIIGRLDGR